jgi:hypothetical protein
MASSKAALVPALNRFRVALVLNAILDLARGDVANQLGELKRVARALDAFLSHQSRQFRGA